jgi:phosphatidylinositol alpha 1,6-mannosyltransferase
METRRIALVTEKFYPAVDGTTTTLKQVADHLIDAGHEVLIVAPGPGLSTYRRSHVARIRPLDRPGRQVREALERFRPELVHVTSPGTLGRKALKHARRLGAPTLVVQHALPQVAVSADRVVATSPFLADRLKQLAVEAAVWAPGVDTRAFNPDLRDQWLHDKWSRARSREGRRVVVGYAGSLHKRHGVRRLAELATVAGIRLVVIGEGPQRVWLERHLPAAKFTGALTTGDLAAALASLDLLVHPGEEESCCHALREASATGLPVVAPRAGGAVGVVRPMETGLLYDPASSTGLRRAVEALAADSHRALMGTRGRELSTRSWSDACAELVAEHYDPLIGARLTGAGRRH